MTTTNPIAIIGGGASGLMCAAMLLRSGQKVRIFERNDKVARKLGITGKGRCNLTNNCTLPVLMENIPTNSRFLYSALSAFTPADTMAFFETMGVPLKTERGNRVFPVSDRASDIVNALRRATTDAEIVHARVTEILTNEQADGARHLSGVLCEDGRRYAAEQVVVATGGLSYPQTGSDGDGYRFADMLSIARVQPTPSLCPLETEEKWCRALMGLSLKNVSLRFIERASGKTVYEDFGEMLFTHFGVSGPMILSASAHLDGMREGKYGAVLNLKPALDEKQLNARLLRDFAASPNKNFSSILSGLLPAKMVPVFGQLTGIDSEKKVHDITRAERITVLRMLHSMPFTVRGFRPIAEAIVTKGGISVKELNPKTMACKRIPGLYFVGEVVDVDGYTGGFNLQIAFATGVAAARAIAAQNKGIVEDDGQ